jgi:hypothetical protein
MFEHKNLNRPHSNMENVNQKPSSSQNLVYDNRIRSDINADTRVISQATKDLKNEESERTSVLAEISPLSCHKVLKNIAEFLSISFFFLVDRNPLYHDIATKETSSPSFL